MATKIWVNIGSGNGLLPDSTKPLPEPVLTYHMCGPVTLIWGQFHYRYLSHWPLNQLENYSSKIDFESPRGQWVKVSLKLGHGWVIIYHIKLWSVIIYPCCNIIIRSWSDLIFIVEHGWSFYSSRWKLYLRWKVCVCTKWMSCAWCWPLFATKLLKRFK